VHDQNGGPEDRRDSRRGRQLYKTYVLYACVVIRFSSRLRYSSRVPLIRYPFILFSFILASIIRLSLVLSRLIRCALMLSSLILSSFSSFIPLSLTVARVI